MDTAWNQIQGILEDPHPGAALQRAHETGLLSEILPEVDALWGIPQRADFHPEVDTGVHICRVVDAAKALGADTAGLWAALTHDVGKAATPKDLLPAHPMHEKRGEPILAALQERIQPPEDAARLATLVEREHGNMHACLSMGAKGLLHLLERCDALNDPATFRAATRIAEADARGRGGDFPKADYPQRTYLEEAAQRLRQCRDVLQGSLPETNNAAHDVLLSAAKTFVEATQPQAAPAKSSSPAPV